MSAAEYTVSKSVNPVGLVSTFGSCELLKLYSSK